MADTMRKNPDARTRGGADGSSNEAPVMGVKQRGSVIRLMKDDLSIACRPQGVSRVSDRRRLPHQSPAFQSVARQAAVNVAGSVNEVVSGSSQILLHRGWVPARDSGKAR